MARAVSAETHCDQCQPGSKVAKDLNIYLGQIYGYIKKGLVENHKVGGYPEGKGVEVVPDEVRAAMAQSRRGGGKTKSGKGPVGGKGTRGSRKATDDGALPAATRKAKRKIGEIVSFDGGQNGSSTVAKGPRMTLAQVIASNGRLTFLDDGGRKRTYSGGQIDNIVMSTERLSTLLGKGLAHIEHPTFVLGMVLFAFVTEGKLDLAESLEKWMIKHDISVVVPDILDLDDDDEEPIVRGAVVTREELEAEASDDDDDEEEDDDD